MEKEEEGTGVWNRAGFIFGSVAVNGASMGSARSLAYCELLDGLPGSFHPLEGPYSAARGVVALPSLSHPSFPTHYLTLPECMGFQVIAWLLPDYMESQVKMPTTPPVVGLHAVPGHCLTPLVLHEVLPLQGLFWTTGLFQIRLLLVHWETLIHVLTSLLNT